MEMSSSLHLVEQSDHLWGCAHLQATVGSDGRVLLFDSSLFISGAGGVISPAAAQQVSSHGSAIVGLEWLSGKELSSHKLSNIGEQSGPAG